MGKIVKLENINFPRLNNAEFTYFAEQIIGFVETGTVEALHVPEDAVNSFKANQKKLVDLVNQSRVAEETARIAETDKQEDDLLSYILTNVKNACNHPIEGKRTAAQALYNQLKPYRGVQSLPQRQQVQTVDGMLLDLDKPENKAHVTTLGLTGEVSQLATLNDTYKSLLSSRADAQAANPVESAKPIRTVMYDEYEEIVFTAWAFSIAAPSEALTAFVGAVNKLIADTGAAYNLRMGQRKKAKDKDAADE